LIFWLGLISIGSVFLFGWDGCFGLVDLFRWFGCFGFVGFI